MSDITKSAVSRNLLNMGMLNKSRRETLIHSLVEMSALLACASLVIILASLVFFISAQGAKYFLPMSAFKVTTYHQNQTNNNQSTVSVEYVLSHDSAKELNDNIAEKLATQYANANESLPRFSVTEAQYLYLLNTHTGKAYLGELVGLRKNDTEAFSLEDLNAVRTTVNTLSANRTDIQLTKLKPLHEELANFAKRGVSADTPAYATKLEAFLRWQQNANTIHQQIQGYVVKLKVDTGKVVDVPLIDVKKIYQPNQLGGWEYVSFTAS